MDTIIIKNDPNDTNYYYSSALQSYIKKDKSFDLNIYGSDIFITDYFGKNISIDNLPENFYLSIYAWQMEKFDIIKANFFYKYNIEDLKNPGGWCIEYFYLERRPVNTKCAIR